MESDPKLAARLHEALPVYAAQVVWAVRHEMARTVDDVLARFSAAFGLTPDDLAVHPHVLVGPVVV